MKINVTKKGKSYTISGLDHEHLLCVRTAMYEEMQRQKKFAAKRYANKSLSTAAEAEAEEKYARDVLFAIGDIMFNQFPITL